MVSHSPDPCNLYVMLHITKSWPLQLISCAACYIVLTLQSICYDACYIVLNPGYQPRKLFYRQNMENFLT